MWTHAGKDPKSFVLHQLIKNGWNVRALHHAEAILTHDLDGALVELESILLSTSLPMVEVIQSGGGESQITQRLRRALAAVGWKKHNFEVKQVVDGAARASHTHEIDHVKVFGNHTAALEIEWNNKDPFYDRDLENFQRLHSVGAISVGIIVTRGDSLQSAFRQRVEDFARANGINSAADLSRFYGPSAKQAIKFARPSVDFPSEWARVFVANKYGQATTHWNKLMDRMNRGVGNPCPLLLIGIPDTVIVP